MIKVCDVNDLSSLVPLFDDYRQHFKQASQPELVKQYLQDRLENNQAHIFLSLDNQENPIGFVLLYPTFSSIGLAPIWVLNDFYIKAGSNKKQTATEMLNAAIELCGSTDAIRIEVTTRKENYRLHKLYQEFGFEKDYKYDHYFLRVDMDSSANNLLK